MWIERIANEGVTGRIANRISIRSLDHHCALSDYLKCLATYIHGLAPVYAFANNGLASTIKPARSRVGISDPATGQRNTVGISGD